VPGADQDSLGIDAVHIAPDHADVRVLRQTAQLELELPGQPRVVRVEEGHELPSGLPQSGVARRRHALIVLPYVADAGVGCGEVTYALSRVVCGTVDDDEDLKVGPGLGAGAVDGLDHLGRTVVAE
jgi:hypothetical protein